MATYMELYNLSVNADLRNRVQSACSIVANEIQIEASGTFNHENRVKWAKQVWLNPVGIAQPMLNSLLGLSGIIGLTVSQILSGTDTGVRDSVRLAVNTFADGTTF